MTKITILIGKDLDERIQKTSDDITIIREFDSQNLTGQSFPKNQDTIIIFDHGSGSGELTQPILSLQNSTGAKRFIVFSCFSGNLPDHLDKVPISLKTGTSVVTFSSSKHPTSTHRNVLAIQEIIAQTQKGVFIKDKEIERLSYQFALTAKFMTVTELRLGGVKHNIQRKINAHKHPKEYLGALNKKEKDRSVEEKYLLEYLNPENAMRESLSRSEYDRAEQWLEIAKIGKKPYEITHLPKNEFEFLLLAIELLFAEKPNSGHLESFETLLSSQKYKEFNGDLLSAAFKKGDTNVIKVLLDNIGDINAEMKESDNSSVVVASNGSGTESLVCTPLILLLQSAAINKTEIAQSLLNSGANPNCEDSSGNTSLHLAVLMGNVDLISLFLNQNEIQLDIQNNLEQTPIQIAIENSKPQIAAIFFKKLPLERQIEILSDQKLFAGKQGGNQLLEIFLVNFEKEFEGNPDQLILKSAGKPNDKDKIPSTLESLQRIKTNFPLSPDSHPKLNDVINTISTLYKGQNSSPQVS